MMRHASSRRLVHRGKRDGLTWSQWNPTLPPKDREKRPNRSKRRRLNADRRSVEENRAFREVYPTAVRMTKPVGHRGW